MRRQILDVFIEALADVAGYRLALSKSAKGRKRRAAGASGEARGDAAATTAGRGPAEAVVTAGAPSRPAILDSLVTGINAVTKALEQQVARDRGRQAAPPRKGGRLIPTQPLAGEAMDVDVGRGEPDEAPSISLVLVCRPDINPPTLIAHLPMLVTALNSGSEDPSRPGVLLVPLDAGAEALLGKALGLPRAAVVAIRVR